MGEKKKKKKKKGHTLSFMPGREKETTRRCLPLHCMHCMGNKRCTPVPGQL